MKFKVQSSRFKVEVEVEVKIKGNRKRGSERKVNT